ncbi:uncharacterized protein YfaA (DUF2138 family) [Janthinobacterium sp. CG_23.3]|uniref:hypothetical protein n=1 Tax=Janthinobacterium sp. CG_23.3 TaxID=3349634 RepID=UPI0038D4D1C6
MAEIVSRQAAKIVAGTKLSPHEAAGKKRVYVITSPAAAAWAQNDIFASGVRLPIGSRILCNSYVSNEAMGAGVTLDVGLRDWTTKVAIDADGIAAAVDVAAAGRTSLNNGAFVAAGVEYVTTVVSEIYATLGGANPTDDKQIRIEVCVVTTD